MGNYLVIGGTKGIGKSISSKLAESSENVFVAARNSDGSSNFQEVDVTGDFQLDIPEQLDGLVYCPGTINLKPYKRLSNNELLNDFQLNSASAFIALKQALPSLLKSENASAVFFSTVAVQIGMPFHASVAMAKGAIEGMVRSMAAELAPKVRINAIAPSLTDTPLASNLLSNDKKRDLSIERHPMKRISESDEIASMALWLLGENSKSVTGQIFAIDGGMSSIR